VTTILAGECSDLGGVGLSRRRRGNAGDETLHINSAV